MDPNRRFLLHELYRAAPLKVRSRPPYVYLDPHSVDSALPALELLEEPIRVIIPPAERISLSDPRTKNKARQLARLILRANGITPKTERFSNGEITTTRWNLGLLNAEEHAQFLWELPKQRQTSNLPADPPTVGESPSVQ